MSREDLLIDLEGTTKVLETIIAGIDANNKLPDTDINKTINLGKLWSEKAKVEKKKRALEKKLSIDIAMVDEMSAGIKADIEKWVDEERIHYVSKGSGHWVLWRYNNWGFLSTEGMLRTFRMLTDNDYYNIFDQVLDEKNRKITDLTYKWTKEPILGKLNLLDYNFTEPVISDDYHWFFDILIGSIGGEKSENKEHIERLLLNKYLHPEDFMLPALILNDRGGTGKGLFSGKFVKNLFGERLVADNIKISHYIGKFNVRGVGKAYIALNEADDHERIDINSLKAALHSETIMCEEKYAPAFEADNTPLIQINSNSDVGSIKLATVGDTNRRFSIILGNRSLKTILNDCASLVIIDKTPDKCEDWVKDTGQYIVSDKVEIGKWLYHMISKYGDVKHTKGLHGQDYNTLLGMQKPLHIELMEKVFNDPVFNYIRKKALFDMYDHLWGSDKKNRIGRNRFYVIVDDWLKVNKNSIGSAEVHFTTMSGGKVGPLYIWKDQNYKCAVLNELRYLEYDMSGKVKSVNVML